MNDPFKEYVKNGYIVVKQFVPETQTRALLYIAKRYKTFVPIFHTIGEPDDENRLQVPIRNSSYLTNLNICIVNWINNNFPARYQQWNISNWVVLKSLPGGCEQAVHKDFPDFELTQAAILPGGILLALMDGTKFIVYEKCERFVDKSKRMEITLNLGDMLIFSGYLPHSGASYNVENYRLHSQLLISGQSYTENVTGQIFTRRFICKYDPEHVYETATEKHNHQRVCENNPKKAELNLMRKRAVSITCHCGKVFVQQGSFYKHKKRKGCNGYQQNEAA
jgi:hypothetical protein